MEDALNIYIESDDGTYAPKQQFGWQVARYNNSELEIEIFFENPSYISQGTEPDILVVQFSDPDVFTDTTGRKVTKGKEIRKKISSQTE